MYRARDTRLERTVAVKVLPGHLSSSAEVRRHSDAAKLPLDWSSDGRFLLFEAREPLGAKAKLWVLPLSGDRKAFSLLQTPFSESLGAFSPDGRWIAYVSDESGRPEVYVQTFPVSTAKWRVSTNGGTQPRWRRDGKEIFYLASDSRLMAVAVSAGASFEAGIPAALFELGATPGGWPTPPVLRDSRRRALPGHPSRGNARASSDHGRLELDGGPQEVRGDAVGEPREEAELPDACI